MHLVDMPAYYPPHKGGVEAYAHELHRRLLEANPGLRITVFTSAIGAPAGTEHLGDRWKVVRWPGFEIISHYPLPNPGFTKRLRAECGPDTVLMTHTRFYWPHVWASLFAKRAKLRRLHVEHGSSPVQSGNAFVRFVAFMVDALTSQPVLRWADEVVSVSGSAGKFVKDLAGRDAKVLHRGIELPDDLVAQPVEEPPTVVFVGRLINGKGVADLLNATAEVHRRGLPLRLRLLGDGPNAAELKALTGTLGLAESVEFVGAVDHDTALAGMARGTVFVNPSWTEGLPTTVLEAAAIGCNVVATDVGGTAEIITDGVTGRLVPARDVTALANALEAAVRDPERAAKATKLREITRQNFSWDTAVAEFTGLLAGGGAAGRSR
ncbi:glycosyltransferase [Lentzea sp.]|uniref:glycosyltransferase family 4 protein n=1 Tax=Lentzea sp. TaxID=56099 RepID=UPI002CA46705|nr:glycosyltransferase [Lentzea sp.]HUQ55538.1 glycosyltransferase [Lentzea sp.]